MKIVIVIVVLIVVLMGAALLWSLPHWWSKSSGAVITYDGEVSSASNLYRARDGKFLLDLVTKDGDEFFVVDLSAKRIGIPNRSSFWMVFGYAYSKNVSPQVVYMDDRIKVARDPELHIQPTSFEFTTTRGNHVRVIW